MLMDCRSCELQPVPLPQGVSVVIADTGKRRGLLIVPITNVGRNVRLELRLSRSVISVMSAYMGCGKLSKQVPLTS